MNIFCAEITFPKRRGEDDGRKVRDGSMFAVRLCA